MKVHIKLDYGETVVIGMPRENSHMKNIERIMSKIDPVVRIELGHGKILFLNSEDIISILVDL